MDGAGDPGWTLHARLRTAWTRALDDPNRLPHFGPSNASWEQNRGGLGSAGLNSDASGRLLRKPAGREPPAEVAVGPALRQVQLLGLLQDGVD